MLHVTMPARPFFRVLTLQEALVKQSSDAELEALGLAPPPRPVVPKGLDKLPMRQRLHAVQVRG